MLRMDSWIGYRLDLIVDPIWIRMVRMDINVKVWFKCAKVIILNTYVEDGFMNFIFVWFDFWSILDMNFKVGYKC